MIQCFTLTLLFLLFLTAPCSATDYIYITKHGTGLLRVDMDGLSSTVVSGATSYAQGTSINADGSQVLIGTGEGTVMAQRFATSDLSLLASYPMQFSVYDLVCNTAQTRYYFADRSNDRIRVFDADFTLVTDISVASPTFLQMSPSRKLLFAFRDPGYDKLVSVIDTSTNAVVYTTADTNLDWNQNTVGFNNNETRYYIWRMNGARDTNTIEVHDATTHATLKVIDVPFIGVGNNAAVHVRAFAPAPDGRHIYIAGGRYSEEYCLFSCTPEKFNFVVLDTASDTIQYLKVVDDARFLFLSDDGNSLYIGTNTQIVKVNANDPTIVLSTFTLPTTFQTFSDASHRSSYTTSTANLTPMLQLLLLSGDGDIEFTSECDMDTGSGCNDLENLEGDIFAVRFGNGQYYIESFFSDPNGDVQSAYLNNPDGSSTTLTLGLYPSKPAEWWSNPNYYIGANPSFPQTWTGVITLKNGKKYKITKVVSNWEWAQ